MSLSSRYLAIYAYRHCKCVVLIIVFSCGHRLIGNLTSQFVIPICELIENLHSELCK